jgi:hypothetical protein
LHWLAIVHTASGCVFNGFTFGVEIAISEGVIMVKAQGTKVDPLDSLCGMPNQILLHITNSL